MAEKLKDRYGIEIQNTYYKVDDKTDWGGLDDYYHTQPPYDPYTYGMVPQPPKEDKGITALRLIDTLIEKNLIKVDSHKDFINLVNIIVDII